ncbi:MAG TPA: hypothetical protein VF188_08135 [Longimicrobiales bacterium]
MSGPSAELERRLAEAIAASDPELQDRIASDPAAYLDLVALTAEADAYVARLLRAAVSSARTAGHSWEAIGRRLGMSRQAAQQRFGRGDGTGVPPVSGETRRLSPLDAFNEMEVLDRAGRCGWHSVGYGPLFHVVEKSDQQWEHRRVYAWSRARRELEAAGWRRIGSMRFPWAYYARPTGEPALEEPEGEEWPLGG